MLNVDKFFMKTPYQNYKVSLAIYRITHYYLPPDTSEYTPTLTPASKAGTRFTYPKGMEG